MHPEDLATKAKKEEGEKSNWRFRSALKRYYLRILEQVYGRIMYDGRAGPRGEPVPLGLAYAAAFR